MKNPMEKHTAHEMERAIHIVNSGYTGICRATYPLELENQMDKLRSQLKLWFVGVTLLLYNGSRETQQHAAILRMTDIWITYTDYTSTEPSGPPIPGLL